VTMTSNLMTAVLALDQRLGAIPILLVPRLFLATRVISLCRGLVRLAWVYSSSGINVYHWVDGPVIFAAL
jgi:hypothetical protein